MERVRPVVDHAHGTAEPDPIGAFLRSDTDGVAERWSYVSAVTCPGWSLLRSWTSAFAVLTADDIVGQVGERHEHELSPAAEASLLVAIDVPAIRPMVNLGVGKVGLKRNAALADAAQELMVSTITGIPQVRSWEFPTVG
jgi:hypothetical protein